jgi:salicylate hydroxylase
MGLLSGQSCIVIGAGIAGLALARGLALRGADVQVLEQAEALTEVGAGIQIAPNGAAVLRGLGLGEALAGRGLRMQAVQLRDGANGRAVLRMDLTRRPQDRDYFCLHRADLIDMLRAGALAAGARITLGTQAVQVDLSGQIPMVQHAAGNVAAPLVFGADGLHSVMRGALAPLSAPFFTGQVAWRATITGEGQTAEPQVQVFMGAGRHLVSYPLRGGALRNIVAVEERSSFSRESWSAPADLARMRAAFAGFCPQVCDWLAKVCDAGEWGLHRHAITPVWGKVLPQGAAFILGDAAHPTLPFLAQGASMSLEDGAILTQLLDSAPTAAALDRYAHLRAARTGRIIAAANANARNYHLSGAAKHIAHLALRAIGATAPNLMLRRFDWLYGYDATRESL